MGLLSKSPIRKPTVVPNVFQDGDEFFHIEQTTGKKVITPMSRNAYKKAKSDYTQTKKVTTKHKAPKLSRPQKTRASYKETPVDELEGKEFEFVAKGTVRFQEIDQKSIPETESSPSDEYVGVKIILIVVLIAVGAYITNAHFSGAI